MGYKYDDDLVPTAQTLRKNMTAEEKRLWYDFLNKLPMSVRRQKNIGRFIVDFYIAKSNLVIELDGSQHGTPEHRKADRLRDAELNAIGLSVLRYSNLEINNNFQGVCADILKRIGLTFNDLKR